MTQQHNGPKVAIEALRPKFWEVSAERVRKDDFATPFHKMRVLEQITDSEMAAKLDMNLDEYLDFELGNVRPVLEDIMNFCDAVHCHPLDLYAEPWGGVPLPREIFEALISVVEDKEFYDEAYRQRARDRLEVELRQAEALVTEGVNEYKPLFIAMGYSPDLKTFNAPLYTAPQWAQTSSPPPVSPGKDLTTGKDAVIDTAALIDQGVEHPRFYIENCLNAYEIELETRYNVHLQLSTNMVARIAKNKEIMRGLALHLYGEAGADVAAARLTDWLVKNPGARERLRETYLSNLALISPLLPQHIAAQNRQDQAALNEMRTKARLLFQAVTINIRNDQNFPGETASKHARAAYHEWNSFKIWRASPRTQRSLDWFDNWLVLCGLLKSQNPLRMPQMRGPAEGPSLPAP